MILCRRGYLSLQSLWKRKKSKPDIYREGFVMDDKNVVYVKMIIPDRNKLVVKEIPVVFFDGKKKRREIMRIKK